VITDFSAQLCLEQLHELSTALGFNTMARAQHSVNMHKIVIRIFVIIKTFRPLKAPCAERNERGSSLP
jgi:hypothetical protein